MQTAFLLFSLHGILPSVYHEMLPGEKIVTRAFLEKEQELKNG